MNCCFPPPPVFICAVKKNVHSLESLKLFRSAWRKTHPALLWHKGSLSPIWVKEMLQQLMVIPQRLNMKFVKWQIKSLQTEPALKPNAHKLIFLTVVLPPVRTCQQAPSEEEIFHPSSANFTVISKNNWDWEQFPEWGKQQNTAHGICPIVRSQRQRVNGTFPSSSKHRRVDNTFTRNRAARSLVSLSNFAFQTNSNTNVVADFV